MASSLDHSGPLQKLTSNTNLKGWNSRYIGLNNLKRELYVWSSPGDYQIYQRTHSSNWIELVLLHNSSIYVSDYLGVPHGFEISTPTGNHFFAANDQESLNQWLHALMASGATAKAPEKEIILWRPDSAGIGGGHSHSQGSSVVEFRRIVTDSYAKYGYLQKRGAINTAYKTRFFRTAENAAGQKALVYFKHPDSVGFQGFILLQGVKIEDLDNPLFEFTIQTPDRLYQIRAPSKAEKASWIQVLQALAGGENSSSSSVPEGNYFNSIVAEDLYAILGLNPTTATAESIQTAYKEKAKEFHPDRNQDPSAAHQFALVHEAYNVLKYPARRAEYEYKRKLYLEQKNDEKNNGIQESKQETMIPNLAASDLDSPGDGKRYKQRQKKNQGAAEEKEPAAAPLLAPAPVQTYTPAPVPVSAAAPTHSKSPSIPPHLPTQVTSPSTPAPASPSPSAASSSPAPANASPEPVRVGEDGKIYRHRVVKKPQIAKDEKSEEPSTNAPPPSLSAAAAANSSPARSTVAASSSSSSSAAIPSAAGSFASITPQISAWQRGIPLWKLSHGFKSFKQTTVYISPANGSTIINADTLFHLKWDSNAKAELVLDSNFRFNCGVEKCSEWVKPGNQKKLPNKDVTVKFVFEVNTPNKVSSFAATNAEDFARVQSVLQFIEAEHRRKLDEKLNALRT